MHTSAICMHMFGSCSLSQSAYEQLCIWMRQWVTHISIQSQRISVCPSAPPSLPRRPSLLRHTGHSGNDCKLISSSIYRRVWHLMSSVSMLSWTLMSRLRLKSLMRSCVQASRQLEMLTWMVRWAARPLERQTIAGSNQHRSRCPPHCCVWILYMHTWRWRAVT